MPMSQLFIDAEDGHKLAILAAKKNLLFSPKIPSNENELLVSIFFKVHFLLVITTEQMHYLSREDTIIL